jgi:ribosomal protein S18 acetylase RimI-like enzyme
MITIIEINDNNKYLINDFLNNSIPSTFRYFNKRTIDVLKNHIITLLLLVNNLPIGYAHIDFDDNKHWFGICILDNYQRKGHGKKIMEYIFNHEKIKNMDKIYLTVDKLNTGAIYLYHKFNFYTIEEKDSYFLMCSNL